MILHCFFAYDVEVKILGVYYGHNSTAVLFVDGRVADCVSEERFTGVKNQSGLPKRSIDYILQKNNLENADLDSVVVPAKSTAPIYASEENKKSPLIQIINYIYFRVPLVKSTYGLVSFYNPRLRKLGRFFYYLLSRTVGAYTSSKERRLLINYLKIPESKLIAYDHHTSHAYAAYYSSPYNKERALVLTLDAEGDGICATVNVFENDKFERISQTLADNSLGLMYAAVTMHLGMKVAEHEYKVMGLAPYAKDYSVDKSYLRVKDLFSLGGKDGLEIHSKFDMRQMPRFLREEMSDVRFDVLAGVFQKLLEEIVLVWVKQAIRVTGAKTLCCGGGVFMNVKLNQKITELGEIEKIFFMPSGGDESSPIGACFVSYLGRVRKESGEPPINPIRDLYWGPSYTINEIERFIKENGVEGKYRVEFCEDMEKRVAGLLSERKIVGRMSGRMEWGARALGNRTILANPSDADVVMIINEQMKDRDFWMPFAPSLLKERAKDYLINPKNVEAPYMVLSFDTTPLARKDLKAALHPYDFTCRPQIVEQSWNPSYYKILKEFEELTGIGGVLNTSFNLHGFPIVLGPKETYNAFEKSGLQYLALENYLISKYL